MRLPVATPTRRLAGRVGAMSDTSDTLRTAWYADHDCQCGAPMTTDGRSVWCVRGRDCPTLPSQFVATATVNGTPVPVEVHHRGDTSYVSVSFTALNAVPQCPHGLPAGGACADCDEDMDASRSLLTIAQHYATSWPLTDAGRLARAYLAQLDEAGVP